MVNINDINNNSTKIRHMISDLFHLLMDKAYLADTNVNGTFDKYAL